MYRCTLEMKLAIGHGQFSPIFTHLSRYVGLAQLAVRIFFRIDVAGHTATHSNRNSTLLSSNDPASCHPDRPSSLPDLH